MQHWWKDTDWDNLKYFQEKNLSQCNFTTMNTMQTDLGTDPGLCSERPVTNCQRLVFCQVETYIKNSQFMGIYL
jgi:hypothetical protein